MDASVKWMNEYLDPPASTEDQAELLTRAGFPLEGRQDLPDGDACQDFEMTSNRGDCVCHVGLAREVAAISGRTLKPPAPVNSPTGPAASGIVSVTNHEPALCPLYTARIIRGVTVKPSPDWLADRLRAIGQIPRNNIVDATNFVLFEIGQPTHVFDLTTLKGPEIIVRMARPDEPFLPIGEGESEIKLRASDLVIADSENAVAIGGVKGGAHSAVTDKTTDLLLEAATFDPVTVRNTSRHFKIDSASAYRFERGVHPATVNPAAERLVELILQIAGGELCDGVVFDGAPIPEAITASMRLSRCRTLMGVEISDEQMIDGLERLGFAPRHEDDLVHCTVPMHRLDIQREVDLIEEVCRMYGMDNIPVQETIAVRVAPLQPTEMGRRAVCDALVGMGYVETVTHSLIGEEAASPFLPAGARLLKLDDERTRAAPILQPSIASGLLRVRKHNQDHGASELALFEMASVFTDGKDGQAEHPALGLLTDIADGSAGLRPLRGAIARLAELLLGPDHTLGFDPTDEYGWLEPGTAANVILNEESIGWIGVASSAVQKQFGLDRAAAVGELRIHHCFETFPPENEVRPLPAFPAIERDVSAILKESVRWREIETTIGGLGLDMLESTEFVTTFRGKQVGAGRKSETIRLRFRAPDRTLRHEEVDPQVEEAVRALKDGLGAEIRG